MATSRDELMRKFGPILLEAFAIMVLDETNRIRQYVGMPKITKQQVLDEISNHLSTLTLYDWMTKDFP